ncbi:MAG: YdcF family protein [Pseudomonadota bacterium]
MMDQLFLRTGPSLIAYAPAEVTAPVSNIPHPEKTAIIVMGAAVWEGGVPSPTLKRRIAAAAECYHQGRAPWVIATGGLGRFAPSEAEVVRSELVAVEVPYEAVLLEDRATSTFENALFSIELMRKRDLQRAMIVSDGYHLPRAVMTFRMLGLKAHGWAVSRAEPMPRARWVRAVLREGLSLPFYIVRLIGHRARRGLR